MAHTGAATTASSFHAFNPVTQTGRRRLFIMTTIQIQRADAALPVPVLSRQNPDICPSFIPAFTVAFEIVAFDAQIVVLSGSRELARLVSVASDHHQILDRH